MIAAVNSRIIRDGTFEKYAKIYQFSNNYITCTHHIYSFTVIHHRWGKLTSVYLSTSLCPVSRRECVLTVYYTEVVHRSREPTHRLKDRRNARIVFSGPLWEKHSRQIETKSKV